MVGTADHSYRRLEQRFKIMSDIVETIQEGEYKIEIAVDIEPTNPRENDNLGRMYVFHRNYTLGDKHNLTVEELQEIVNEKSVVSLPVYLYDHSGLRVSVTPFHCPWDSGQIGFIYVTHEDIRREYGKVGKKEIETVLKVLESEVKEYNDFLSGNCYGFMISKEDEVLESSWGFLGDVKYCIEEAKSVVKNLQTADLIELNEQKVNSFDNHFGMSIL